MITDSRMASSLIRILVAATMAVAALTGAASQSDAGTSGAPVSVIGTWTGESVCVGDRPACKNEVAVYRFEAVAGKPGVVTMLADKIINGQREPMGKLDFQYDEAKGTLSGEFTRGQTHGLWQFQVSGDTMEGTLVILPARDLARRVKVRRVRDDQVPAAPARELYEGAQVRRPSDQSFRGALARVYNELRR
jgi:hypothetical protein